MKKFVDKIDAIAIYGSCIRGDTDKFSDKDILIISENLSTLIEYKRYFNEIGFSCSTYTWKKLSALAQNKALFIQHIKGESIIIQDSNNMLREILFSYSPANDYSKEIIDALNLMKLTSSFIDSKIGIGWALDVLYVGLRNISILYFANKKLYLFSYTQILEKYREMSYIDNDDFNALFQLRKYKYYYREKKYCYLPEKESVFRIQKIISKIFDVTFNFDTVSWDSFLRYSLFSCYKNYENNRYLKLRLLEGAFNTSIDHLKVIDQKLLNQILNITNFFNDPSCYHFNCSNFENLRENILDILKNYISFEQSTSMFSTSFVNN